MKTDKQLDRLFKTNPAWLFELTGLDAPGPSEMHSFTVKALERRADGLIVPQDPAKPLTIVQYQFDADPKIYTRIVTEMAAVQGEHDMREVQGIILFRYAHLDPQTKPWNQVVRSFLLRESVEALERAQPQHPLVAVFRPVLLSNRETLEKEAVQYYRQIKNSALAEPLKATLVDVFFSWLEQRLPDLGRKELEAMFVGELPPLEETKLAQEFIAIGEARGEARGKAEGIIEAIQVFIEARQGSLPETVRQQLQGLSLPSLHELLPLVYQGMTLEQLQARLQGQARP